MAFQKGRNTFRLKAKEPVSSRIVSPRTNRPLVEDLFGVAFVKKLRAMLEKDVRLSSDMKFTVFFNVLRRKNEMENGSMTLNDLISQESEKATRKSAN